MEIQKTDKQYMSKQVKQKIVTKSLNTNITEGLQQDDTDRNLELILPNQMPKTISHSQLNTKQMAHSNFEDNIYDQCKRLKLENKNLRAVNKQLRKQLEDFSKRLDQSLKKQDHSQKKMKIGQEIVESMELKNAYKLCDIYKKEIGFLKRRQSQTRQGRVDELQNQIFELQKQKQKLMLEIKDLKKTVKQQQKGLREMAGPNAIKLLQQNEKLRQSIRRFQMLYQSKQQSASLKKTRQAQQDKNQDNQIESLKNKVIKSNRKVSILMNQNQKLKEYVQQLRNQILQKNKDSLQFKQRLASLRKQNEQYRKRRIETEPEVLSKVIQTKNQSQMNHSTSRHLKLKSEFQMEGDRINRHKKNSASLLTQKYPKMVQKGQKTESGVKWNDHQFSSKIKQIQVSPHPLGHIKQLHFRYEKGESNKTLRNKYASFCCEQNTGEYIKYIRGGFKNNLLRYLIIETNKGRKSNFCEFQLEDQCTNFEFSCADNQYLGSFFGQNTKEGICRLGCFIQLKK